MMTPALDPLESRQLLSTVALPVHGPMPEHHHHGMRIHHAALVGRVHSPQLAKPDPPATAKVSAASSSFNVVAQFNNASFAATAAIADNDIWAVGSSTSSGTTQPFAVHFDGTSWSAVPTPTLSRGGSFRGVTAVASNDVWAVGYQSVSSSMDEPLIEHWNGTSWSIVSSPSTGVGLNAVSADASNDVWAVGENGNISVDLVEHWDGKSWSVVSSPAFSGGIELMYGVSADASNDVWAVGDSPGVILHFGGKSWSRTVLPPARVGGPALKAVAALSPSDVWAVGMVRPGSGSINWRPVVEHWDGTSWSQISSPDPNPVHFYNLLGIAAISASDIWATGGVGIENWNGTSWSLVSSTPGVGVAALSDGTVVVVSANGSILEN
jgi:hypothetical protein